VDLKQDVDRSHLSEGTVADLKQDVDRSHLSKGYSGRFCKHYTALSFQMSNCKLLRITLLHGVGIISARLIICSDF
jgi:hypothetical protein